MAPFLKREGKGNPRPRRGTLYKASEAMHSVAPIAYHREEKKARYRGYDLAAKEVATKGNSGRRRGRVTTTVPVTKAVNYCPSNPHRQSKKEENSGLRGPRCRFVEKRGDPVVFALWITLPNLKDDAKKAQMSS